MIQFDLVLFRGTISPSRYLTMLGIRSSKIRKLTREFEFAASELEFYEIMVERICSSSFLRNDARRADQPPVRHAADIA